jgi:peptidoglycan/xylan/chitin deacetylase (PgdA/CDA1 family)
MKIKSLLALADIVILLVLVSLAVTVVISDATTPAFAPIRKGVTEGAVALTFNVYMGEKDVSSIVRILSDYGVTATFFLGGIWVKKHPETAQFLVQNGLCIGSHGYSHLDHSALDYAANIAELNRAQAVIREVTGISVDLFAPPSGAYGTDALKAAEDLGYRVIMWSKDTIDWRDQDAALILSRATADVHSGDIILMHPTAATVEALPAVIESYLAKGLRLVSIYQMLD